MKLATGASSNIGSLIRFTSFVSNMNVGKSIGKTEKKEGKGKMPTAWKKSRRAKWREIKVQGDQYRWRLTIDILEIEMEDMSGWILPGKERHQICKDELIARGLYKIGDRQPESDVLLPNSQGGGAVGFAKHRLVGAAQGKKQYWDGIQNMEIK